MAKDPAFLFYSSDFLSGVADLTMEERGQYITLLCLQHQKGRLSEKIIKLNGAAPDVLKKFLRDEKGNFYNPRLEEVVVKRKKHSDHQRENAKKRWKPDANSMPTGMPNECQTDAKTVPLENENVIENEIRNENFGKSENLLIPRMSTLFVKHNPNYPANKTKDFQSLFSIAKFLCEQGQLRGSPELHVTEILAAWEPVCMEISTDKFYKQKSLITISNHIQEIIQNALHGKSDAKNGKQINRSLLNEKFNQRYPDKGQASDKSGPKVA